MICELHNEEAELCESHIIPKFVYKWMKKTGPGRFRQVGKRNKPINDGIKKQMLCKSCENKFSVYEKWFNEEIFIPYLTDNNLVVKNKPELQKLIISVLWRILRLFKDDESEYKFKSNLDKAEIEWRNYLLNDKPLKKYINQHFILIDNDYWIDIKNDLYFSRDVDIEIAESNEICFVYAKFSRFILIGEIIGFDKDDFKNTNIYTEKEFRNTNQLLHNDVTDFLTSRAENTITYSDLSDIQKDKNDIYFKNKKLAGTDYFKIIKKYY